MKAITSITAAAVLILGTLPATADSETEEKETRRGKGHAALLEELDLNEEQKTQVEAILAAQKEKRRELFAEHRETRRETRREAREQMKALREETEGELKKVLSDEQFERLQEMREERRDRPGKRNGGGHGGERGGMGKRGRGQHHLARASAIGRRRLD